MSMVVAVSVVVTVSVIVDVDIVWKGIGYAKRRVRGQQQLRKDWERMLDCLSLGYATSIYDHSTLAHHDRGWGPPHHNRQRRGRGQRSVC